MRRHWFEPNGEGHPVRRTAAKPQHHLFPANALRHDLRSRDMVSPLVQETMSRGIEHRLTKPNHPWSREDQKTVRGTVFPRGGQVERINRTIKEATVKRFHYDDHDQLRTHLADFLAAYTFTRRLKTLNGLTPYEFICKIRTSEPERFILNPIHLMPGLNTWQRRWRCPHAAWTVEPDPCRSGQRQRHRRWGLRHAQLPRCHRRTGCNCDHSTPQDGQALERPSPQGRSALS